MEKKKSSIAESLRVFGMIVVIAAPLMGLWLILGVSGIQDYNKFSGTILNMPALISGVWFIFGGVFMSLISFAVSGIVNNMDKISDTKI